ncbi:hypothetical protein B0H19DRAFT_1369749 [Mycena capillaripes]|nr:hypothetical protein B0H19DRAFT_1369749 [Mycena capillaripes]
MVNDLKNSSVTSPPNDYKSRLPTNVVQGKVIRLVKNNLISIFIIPRFLVNECHAFTALALRTPVAALPTTSGRAVQTSARGGFGQFISIPFQTVASPSIVYKNAVSPDISTDRITYLRRPKAYTDVGIFRRKVALGRVPEFAGDERRWRLMGIELKLQ